MKLLKLLGISLGLLVSSCARYKISDYPLFIRLPGSKQCYEIKVLSGEEKVYNEILCDEMVSKSIMLTSESWKLLRGDLQRNCQATKCEQITGAADDLFLTIDRILQKSPIP